MTLREIGAPDPQRLAKHEGQHKYDHGHALVLAGPPGHGGAARLAARAALRVGAGLVTLGCPAAAVPENAARLDAVMLRAIDGGGDLERLLEDNRLSALCLGPGLGLAEQRAELVAAALASRRPTVLDADALTLLARDPALAAHLHPCCVLTPHAGEFRRMFPDLDPSGDRAARAAAAAAAADRAGCILLLKGAETVIAGPGGPAVHPATGVRAAPWLATAGAGDVLAGLIAGLLARGLSPQEAAEAGVWLHVEAARAFGAGLIAEDLPEALPGVFARLGL
ncbi:NAD(P)H-hydrate dehydratase [Rhodobacter sp. NSM]|uniref:NAD(P)H-hydrate dehydratase n=1 Tax=Rhodobacter sp. NSM TaxID=3457501 RepID=UPI003FD47E53